VQADRAAALLPFRPYAITHVDPAELRHPLPGRNGIRGGVDPARSRKLVFVVERNEATGQVFVSYVRENSGDVDELQRILESKGIKVWRDTHSLWPGEDWRAKIRNEITNNALVFIACFSRESAGRKKSYQNEELNLAIEEIRKRPPGVPWLIPVRFDDCDIPDFDIGGGRRLSSLQSADLFGSGAREAANRLVEMVLRMLGQYSVPIRVTEWSPEAHEPEPQQVAIFELAPRDLGPNCTIPHALDDQWVSRSLLREMAASGRPLHELGEAREALVRREYLRALVTARKIVINRSYLLKNQVITRDYNSNTANRAAFVELLRIGAIVPFLLKERTPIESQFATDPDAVEGARIWNELLMEHNPGVRGRVEIQCVRLSWDDAENARLVKERFFDAFADGIKRAASLDYDRLLGDVGAKSSYRFKELLRLMPKISASAPGGALTRAALYERYVIEDQENASSGKYDFTKPDMVAFKWLFDLIYNSNLAAALGLALVAPADSAHRSVIFRPGGSHEIDAALSEQYGGSFLRTVAMEAVQDAIFVGDYTSGSLSIFDGLTLSDVVAIRDSDVWRRYSEALDSLLAEPWLLAHPEHGLPFVYGRYAALIDHISGTAPRGPATDRQ
jgi:hypothetical protein